MAMTTEPSSSSLDQPDYWWYRARRELLGPYLREPEVTLDVGSADGLSAAWMRGNPGRVTLDLHPRGLTPGEGVCGSAMALPFAEEVFDVVAAFDVIEHCESETQAMAELTRVLAPGDRLLLSVPAYQWAWSDHDVRAGHFRRYTKSRLVNLVVGAGLAVERATYAFSAVFPLFAAERAVPRLQQRVGRRPDPGLAPVSPRVDRMLMGLSGLDHRLPRARNVGFGSSIFRAALEPELGSSR